MDAFHRGLQSLQRLNDPQLVQAYQQFVDRLATFLTPEEMDLYASVQQRPDANLTPEQRAVAQRVEADAEAPGLYRHYLTILGDRQVHGGV